MKGTPDRCARERKRLLIGEIFVLISWGSLATAGVEGTHHDMRLYNHEEEQSVCGYCHVPHGALSEENLFTRTSAAEGLGPIGVFCYSCHDGTVVPTALVQAPDGSVGLEALTKSHGYDIQRIEPATAGLERPEFVLTSGLVDVKDPANPPRTLDCDACHDPHTSDNPPFLRAPFEELCQRCHRGRDGNGGGRWTTIEAVGAANHSHPVGMAIQDSGMDRAKGGLPTRTFWGPSPEFRLPTPTSTELRDPGIHWEMGGHLLGLDRKVGCGTCHSAHLPLKDLLVASTNATPEKTVCAGCHGNEGRPANPGATPYFHPVFEGSGPPYVHDHATHGDVGDPSIPASGTLELFVKMPNEWPLSSRGELLCLTCHRTHQGVDGRRLLRAGPRGEKVICNECHGVGTGDLATDQVTEKGWHHPVGDDDYTDSGVWGFSKTIAWSWGRGLPGDLSDGLQCVDCHTELAKSGHNW